MADSPEQAGIDDLLFDIDQVRGALALRADLDDAFVFSRRGQNRFAFNDIDADGLLQIDIGAGLDGGDRVQGMPVIGGTDQDNVEVLFLEHLAIVGVGARGLFGRLTLAGDFDGSGEHIGIGIADRYHLDGGNLDQTPQIALAVPAGANESDAFGFLLDQLGPVSAEGGQGQTRGGRLEEAAAVDHKSLRDRRSLCVLLERMTHRLNSFLCMDCRRSIYGAL
jgi:hypothetical protein